MAKNKVKNEQNVHGENQESSRKDAKKTDFIKEMFNFEESDNSSNQDSTEETDSSAIDNNDPIAIMERKLIEKDEKYMRLQADFDNFRKRSQKEKQSVITHANKELLLCILPIIDNLERAIASSENPDNAFTKGVDMVYKQLLEELKKQGVKTIEAVNQEFDPTYHQAVMKEASEDVDSNIVIQELQKGYLLNEEVLRPTMVKVSE